MQATEHSIYSAGGRNPAGIDLPLNRLARRRRSPFVATGSASTYNSKLASGPPFCLSDLVRDRAVTPRQAILSRFARVILLALAADLSATHAVWSAPPDAQSLVQDAVDSQSRFFDLPSARIRVESIGRLSAQAVEQAKVSHAKGLAALDAVAEWNRTDELLFDATRLRMHSVTNTGEALTVWNRSVAKFYAAPQGQSLGTCRLSANIVDNVAIFGCLDWLRTVPHRFWWNTPPGDDSPAPRYEFAGETQFRDHACYQFDDANGRSMLFVDPANRRLIGYVTIQQTDESGHKTLDDEQSEPTRAAAEWSALLSQDVFRTHLIRHRMVRVGSYTAWHFDDYRTVAPGVSIPWRIEVEAAVLEGRVLRPVSHRLTTVRRFEPSPSINDSDFEFSIPPGTKVYDDRYVPALVYPYQENFSKAEWDAIVADRKASLDEQNRRSAIQQLRVGQRPPGLENMRWFNHSGLSWSDLAGEFVILQFFSESCGPCRNEIPLLASLHANRAQNDVFVIGVHTIGSDDGAIQEFIRLFEVEYPVCLDVELTAGQVGEFIPGKFSSWFPVFGIPFSVLVNRDGRIAAVGRLEEVVKVLERTVASPAAAGATGEPSSK